MNTKDLSLKLHALFKPLKVEELYEATIETIEREHSSRWYMEENLIGHTIRTAIWVHDGIFLDLDSMLILNTEKIKNYKKYKLEFSSFVPFQTFAPKKTLTLVQKHTLIAYQIPGEYESVRKQVFCKKLSIDK